MKKLINLGGLTRTFNRAGLKFKKHSPEIMVVSGVVGTVVATVLACKATTKLDTVLTESKKKVEKIHEAIEHPETLPEPYSKEDGKKDLTIVYTQTGLKVAKLYAPAVILGGLSIASILGGHRILKKRNVALAATFASVDKAFKDYRGRVVERFGTDLDRELRYNLKTEKIEEVIKDDATGKEKKVKTTIETVDPSSVSMYAKFFQVGNDNWSKDPELNLLFLRRMQDQANDTLKAKGHLFLNEVYDMLGIDRTKTGQVVGWIYDEKNPIGDNYVDFGIYNGSNPANIRFVNGLERTILLDFNVDGNILDMI